MLRRLLATLGVLALLALAPVSAWAASYPPHQPQAGVDDSTVTAGQAVTVSGENWCPNSTIELTLYPGGVPLGQVETDSNGMFSTRIVIPADLAPGNYHIQVTGLRDNCVGQGVRNIPITVVGTGGTAFTGANVTRGALLMALLLVAGAGALLLGRRRRAAHALV